MQNNYIIRGGMEGKKRLDILGSVMDHYSRALFEMHGPIDGKRFLDVGCGGGNIALMVAKMVGATGNVTAIDIDENILKLAQMDALEQGISNVLFLAGSSYDISFNNEFDIVYARFLLSHLSDPMQVLGKMLKALKPGGRMIVEDVQFSGHFCYPASTAFDAYLQYYRAAALNNNHNPEIGPSLFTLFHAAGIGDIHFDLIQPCFNKGNGKWMAYITMDKIKDMVTRQGLATKQEIDRLLHELEAFTNDGQTIMSLPRIFRVWGVKI